MLIFILLFLQNTITVVVFTFIFISLIKSVHNTGQEVDQQAQFLFVSMAPHLINDESEACRQAVAAAITQLLRTVQNNQAARLVDVVMTGFKGDNPSHCQLACRLMSIIIDTLGK